MYNFFRKFYVGPSIFIILFEYLIIAAFTIKYYVFDQLSLLDGKPLVHVLSIIFTLTGAVISFKRARDWGGARSQLGKVAILFAFGFLAWTAGSAIWIYYAQVLQQPIPFPSYADLAYMFVNPFFIIATAVYAYSTSVKNSSDKKENLYFYLVPVCMALLTLFVVFGISRPVLADINDVLKVLLNLYYTGGDIIQLILLVIIGGSIFNHLGTKLKLSTIFLGITIATSYTADAVYAYSTLLGTYMNGDISDLLYATTQLFLVLTVYTMHPKFLIDN